MGLVFLFSLTPMILFVLANGAALEVYSLVWTNILQEFVPVGYGFTGWLVDRVDVALIFIAAGGVAAFVNLLPLFQPSIRTLD